METTKGKALVLRTCNSDMTSHNGFTWSKSGPVECPDWVASTDCGNGLHGALWGQGGGAHFNWSPDAVWQVVEIEEWIDLNGKVKFPRGVVVHTGNQETATKYIIENGASGPVIGASITAGYLGTATAGYGGTATAGYYGTATAGYEGTATAGDDGTATAGYYGTATAGDRGTATAGYYGTATAGYYGTATAGYEGTATAGDYGTATAGDDGTATAGDDGTATAGYYGTATAGDRGTATAGYYGTATAGYLGTATAGYGGTATAGDRGTATAGNGGIIQMTHFDGKRYRIKVGYVGEDGIEPNVPYRLDRDGNFMKVG